MDQNPTMNPLMTIAEIQGVFSDAILTDEADNLVFGSFWGRDTTIRELQGRLTLGQSEGGMTTFNVLGQDQRGQKKKVFTRIGNVEVLEQMTGRVQTDILGEMVHYWLYQRDIIKPDLANFRATLISHNEASPEQLWDAIKTVCPIPLLDHWGKFLIPIMKKAGMIKALQGIYQHGTQINIDEDRLLVIVKQACLEGYLTVQA